MCVWHTYLQAIQKGFVQEIQLNCHHYSPNCTVIWTLVHLHQSRASPHLSVFLTVNHYWVLTTSCLCHVLQLQAYIGEHCKPVSIFHLCPVCSFCCAMFFIHLCISQTFLPFLLHTLIPQRTAYSNQSSYGLKQPYLPALGHVGHRLMYPE